ncbi:hypothetical protein EYF80_040828 [Liparis tanakae]|uniref:Uncharacterized protein n=1 Tax=Liparis tanakae TaxID=230148 RepID=A0A4Z2G6X8_9TELE|nr:hypothetical protein EYF80_040828 [Liparis tanakae]
MEHGADGRSRLGETAVMAVESEGVTNIAPQDVISVSSRKKKSPSTTPTHCHKAVVLVCYHGDKRVEPRWLFGSDARLGRETANAEVE